MKAGTYNEYHDCSGGTNCVPEGTSWSNAVTIKAAPGETVIVQPPGHIPAGMQFYFTERYIILQNLILDGASSIPGQNGVKITRNAHHIRFDGCTIRNFQRSGIHMSSSGDPIPKSDFNEIINTTLDGNGIDAGHNFYIETANNLVDNVISINAGKYGGQINLGAPNDQNNIVRNSTFRGNGFRNGGGGLVITSGAGHKIYNNIFEGNSADGFRIGSDDGWTGKDVNGNPGEILIANCTSYGNGQVGFYISGLTSGTLRLINLIGFNNGGLNIDNNMSACGSQPCFIGITNLTNGTNPLFVNPAGHDFHLQAASPARDGGTSLANIFTTDKDNISRPQGAAWDIGAYERPGP
jgi:curved DNA-binding protein CbpA